MSDATTQAPAFDKNSLGNTIFIAFAVCLVCSLLVSTAAVVLKPLQDANVLNDRNKNILLATGDYKAEDLASAETVSKIFGEKIEDRIIDLATGEDVTSEYWGELTSDAERAEAVAKFDQFKASKKSGSGPLEGQKLDTDPAGIKNLENRSHVYVYTDDTGEKKYIFPIRGYGLWSTLKGFVALESDLKTIAGLTYYEHKETPGLGGEVDNPSWKAQWTQEKYVYDDAGEVKISVVTPQATSYDQQHYKVDSLSGATITSRGVENMLRFWMGEQGFKKFIDAEAERIQASNSTEPQ